MSMMQPEMMQPDLGALLSGAGGPGGAPPSEPPQGGGGAAAAIEHLRQAIQHAQAALQAEPDDLDSQQLAKVVEGLYAILAGRQKEQEQAMGMTPALKTLARG